MKTNNKKFLNNGRLTRCSFRHDHVQAGQTASISLELLDNCQSNHIYIFHIFLIFFIGFDHFRHPLIAYNFFDTTSQDV